MSNTTQSTARQSPVADKGTARAKQNAAGASPALAESIINASIDSMIGLDTGLRIAIWNDTTAQWSGLGYSQVAGRPLYEIFPAAQAVPGLNEALQQALQGAKSFLPATGSFYLPGHFEVHIVPLHDATGAVNGVLQILHDVAHRLKAENELKDLNRQLFRQNSALAAAHEELAIFAKVTAHDLKEPLRKIYTFAELIMMHEAGKLSNTGRYNFRRIQKSVQRMGLLTDDIINFSDLSRSSSPAGEVDMAALLAAELERSKEAIACTGAVIKSTPLPTISGYPAALTQLLRQLLDNALKFHKPDTPPQVQISCQRIAGHDIEDAQAEPGTPYHHLCVADNGIGFEPQYHDRIFQVFQRLHPEGTYHGSGMGLALAQKAARMHNGFIIAESTPGEGSIFHCYLPAA